METEVVWACHRIHRTYQDNPTRNCTRREKERHAEKEMGGQHHRVDWKDTEQQLEEDREQNGMERADCQDQQWCRNGRLDQGIGTGTGTDASCFYDSNAIAKLNKTYTLNIVCLSNF